MCHIVVCRPVAIKYEKRQKQKQRKAAATEPQQAHKLHVSFRETKVVYACSVYIYKIRTHTHVYNVRVCGTFLACLPAVVLIGFRRNSFYCRIFLRLLMIVARARQQERARERVRERERQLCTYASTCTHAAQLFFVSLRRSFLVVAFYGLF